MAGRSAKQLRKLPARVQQDVRAVIDALAANPYPGGSVVLRGQFEGFRRVRVGYRHRIVYTADDAARIVRITWVGTREDVPY